MPVKISLRLGVLLLAAAGLAACNKDYTAYALTSTGSIIQFQTNKPTDITVNNLVTGLNNGQSLVQIAYLPSTGILYGLTNDNEVATVDPTSGEALLVSETPFTTDTLSNVAMAIDPVNGILRITADSSNSTSGRENIEVSTEGAEIRETTTLDYNDGTSGSPQISSLAYTNPITGATSSELYGLDVASQKLVHIGDATSDPTVGDAGQVDTIGPVGVSFTASSGLAIAPEDGTAYAVLGPAAELYTIDLSSGLATLVDTVDTSNYTLLSLVIAPNT